MKALTALLVFSILAVLNPTRATAFGRAGHQITGALAMNFLSLKANKAVRQLLGTTTPEEAAVWMDEQREDPR